VENEVPVKFRFNNQRLVAWILLHQTLNSVIKCEDKVYAKTGLTTQQHAILMAIKNASAPATPTQIADWVDRNLNSITLIVDRMEKNGFVKRVRDIQDRRSIRLSITEKGELYLKNSAQGGWDLIQEVLDVLSDEEIETLKGLLEKVRYKAIDKCYRDKTIKEIVIDENPGLKRFLADSMHDKVRGKR
jgi:MarR family transcriptional regulator, 2-MHQ and catechol-resistance regulon repressor